MWRVVLQLVLRQPQLVADHVRAYGVLATAQVELAARAWQRRALLQALAWAAALMALLLAGMAVLLWAALPAGSLHAPWAMWLTPLLPLALALVCLHLARRGDAALNFAPLVQQWQGDRMLLQRAAPQPVDDWLLSTLLAVWRAQRRHQRHQRHRS